MYATEERKVYLCGCGHFGGGVVKGECAASEKLRGERLQVGAIKGEIRARAANVVGRSVQDHVPRTDAALPSNGQLSMRAAQ